MRNLKEAIWIALVGLLVDVTFNFWARILKFWILKVLKRCPNHSFLWFFYLLSEKSSYLVKLVFRDPGYMKICKIQTLQFSLIFMTPGTWNLAKTDSSIFSNFRDPGYMKICKNQRLQFSLIFVTPGTWKFAKFRHFKKTLIKHDSLNNWIFH